MPKLSDLEIFFDNLVKVYKWEVSVYGFTFSFWNVFIFCILAGILIFFWKHMKED